MQVRSERQRLLVPGFLQRSLLVVVLLVYFVLTGCHSSLKNFSSDGCFQQGPRRSGEPLQHRHNRRYVTTRRDISRRSCHRGSTRAANRVVRKDRWTMGRVPAIRSAVYEYRS